MAASGEIVFPLSKVELPSSQLNIDNITATLKHKPALPSTNVWGMSRPGGDLALSLINGGFEGGYDILRIFRPEDGRSGHNDITPSVSACTYRLGSDTAVNFDIFIWESCTQLRHLWQASV